MFFSWHKLFFAAIPVILCTLLILSGCGGIEKLDSSWRNREITIDGITNEDEWKNARYIYEDPDFILGLMNDKDHIYLSLATSDQALVHKITGFGLTVWFNDTGKKDQTLGFHYPVGMRAGSDRDLLKAGRGSRRRISPENMEKRMKSALVHCEIIVPGSNDEAIRMPVDEISAQGIEAALTVERGVLVYELKVPLVSSESTPYAIGAGASNTVGIGSITGAPDKNAMRQHMGSRGSMGGGMRGGGGRGGGMDGGGNRGSRDTSMFEATEVWFRAELAGAFE